MRKRLAFILVTLVPFLISGCGSRIDAFYETVEYALSSDEDVTLTSSDIQGLNYPAQYVRLNNGPRVVVGLGFDQQGFYNWLSQSNQTLTTYYGRVVKTSGLTTDAELVALASDSDPLQCILRQEANCEMAWRSQWLLGKGIHAQSISQNGVFEYIGEKALELPSGDTVSVEHWKESISVQGSTRTNQFFIEKHSRRIVKSEQNIGGKTLGATFELAELKAYKKDLKGPTISASSASNTSQSNETDSDSKRLINISVIVVEGEQQQTFSLGYDAPQRLTAIYSDALAKLSDESRAAVIHGLSRVGSSKLQLQLEQKRQQITDELVNLRDYFRRSRNHELENETEKLLSQIRRTSFFASYMNGFDWAQANVDAQRNPLVSQQTGDLIIVLHKTLPQSRIFGPSGESPLANQQHHWLLAKNGDIAKTPVALFNESQASECFKFMTQKPLTLSEPKACVAAKESHLNNKLIGLSEAFPGAAELNEKLAKLFSFYSVIEHE